MREFWKNIPGFNGYQVSNLGRVCSFWRVRPIGNNKGTKSYSSNSCRLLKQQRNKRNGYMYVTLRRALRTYLFVRVHRVVLLSFHGPCPKGMETCHEDGDKTNNRIRNLKWGTPKKNAADVGRHEKRLRGENHPGAKLTVRSIIRIRKLLKKGILQKDVARQFGVSKSTISKINCGTTWRLAIGVCT